MAKIELNNTTAKIKEKDKYMYFLYSEIQHKERTNIEAKINKIFIPGTVYIHGKANKYTELSKNPTNNYIDTKIVAEGYLSTMRYTKITSKNNI